MALEGAGGATYFKGVSQWIDDRNTYIRVPLSILLAISDATVAACKGVFFYARSITWLSQGKDRQDGSWHLHNAASRISRLSQQILCRVDSHRALKEGVHCSLKRDICQKLIQKPTNGEIHITDVLKEHEYTELHTFGTEPEIRLESLMTGRSYQRENGADRELPIKLLFDMKSATTREEKLQACAQILTHVHFCGTSEPIRSPEIVFDEFHFPSVEFPSTLELNDDHPMMNALHEIEWEDEHLAHFTSILVDQAKDVILKKIKRSVAIDIERTIDNSQRIHQIGTKKYHSELPESIGEQVDEMWDRVYAGVQGRMADATELDHFREAVLIMDHLSQTGYALSSIPLHLGVFDIGKAMQFDFDPAGRPSGLNLFLGQSIHEKRVTLISNSHTIQLSEDITRLTAQSSFDIGVGSFDGGDDVKVCTMKCVTTIDLPSKEATVTWEIDTGEE